MPEGQPQTYRSWNASRGSALLAHTQDISSAPFPIPRTGARRLLSKSRCPVSESHRGSASGASHHQVVFEIEKEAIGPLALFARLGEPSLSLRHSRRVSSISIPWVRARSFVHRRIKRRKTVANGKDQAKGERNVILQPPPIAPKSTRRRNSRQGAPGPSASEIRVLTRLVMLSPNCNPENRARSSPAGRSIVDLARRCHYRGAEYPERRHE
jgi:hypothetical protein